MTYGVKDDVSHLRELIPRSVRKLWDKIFAHLTKRDESNSETLPTISWVP